MEKKSITVLMFALVIMFAGVVHAATGEKQNQQQQFQEIENYIAQRQQEIKNYYLGRSADLRLRSEVEIRLLEVADIKPVFADFAEWAELTETVLQINGFKNISFGHFAAMTETVPKRFAVAQSQIAEAKNEIFRRYEWAAVDLDRQRRYALTVGLVELEKGLKENVLAPKPKATHGVVTGILHAEENPSAVIDGKIVHDADTIHGVKVVKIHRHEIEFQKNRYRWIQKVRETPKAFWR